MKKKQGVTKTIIESQNLGKGPSGSSDANCNPMLVPPRHPCLTMFWLLPPSSERKLIPVGNRTFHCWQFLLIESSFLLWAKTHFLVTFPHYSQL